MTKTLYRSSSPKTSVFGDFLLENCAFLERKGWNRKLHRAVTHVCRLISNFMTL